MTMRRISGPRPGRLRGRSSRGAAELSVVVVAASLLVGLVFGNGLARTSLDLTDGLTWLKDEPSGQVLQVNPLTGEPMGALDTGDPNDPLQLAQYDGGLVVLNRETGTITSFDLATILQTGQSKVRNGDQVELLVHDEQFFRLDKQEGTFAAIDAVTTRPVGEIWFSETGLVDAKIDEQGTIWTLDPKGLVTELTWSAESEEFIVEDTRQVDHSGPGSVLVAHEKGVTLFGPDNGIVVQVGTGRDVVQGGLDIEGHLSGPGVSPGDLVPVASPANHTVVIVSGDRVIQVPLGTTCADPGAPLAFHASVYVPCQGDAKVLRISPDGKVIGSIRTPSEGREIELVLDDGYLLINVQGSDTGIRVLPNGDTRDFTRRDKATPVRGGKNAAVPDFQQNAAQDRDEGRVREPSPPPPVVEPPIKVLPPPVVDPENDEDDDRGGKDPGAWAGGSDRDGLAAPSSVVATVEGGAVVLRWSHSGRPPARAFEVRRAGGGRVASLDDGDVRELRLDGPVPTTPTAWTVTAVNGRDRAVSAPSNTIPDQPDKLLAPGNVVATAQPGGDVRITWAHGGEVPAEQFRVERSGTVLAADLAGDDRDYVDTGAPLGRPVTYVVIAVNGKARAASAASNPVTPAQEPQPLVAPTGVRATPLGDGTVHLTWAHAGSTPASQFTIATGGGSDVTPSAGLAGGAREATVTVPLGTPVTFTVTAVNGSERQTSAASNAVTPARDPDPVTAPTGVTATAQSDGTVRVTWTHSGTAAAEFVVSRGGSEVARKGGTEREAVIGGIAPGTAVTFTVTAVLGTQSRASAPSNAVTTTGQPGAPTNVRVSATPNSSPKIYRVTVTVTWDAAPDNGSPITQYTADIGGGGLGQRTVTTTGTERTATATFSCNYLDSSCDSLGEDFVATVTATNAFGTGPAGSNQTDVPAPPQPGAPVNVTASGDFRRTGTPIYADGTCTMTVTWGAAADNGLPVEGYDITFDGAGAAITRTTDGGGRSATATRDCEGGNGATDFQVSVRARNSSATGPAANATGTINTGGRWTCWPDPPVGPGEQCR